MKLTVTFFKDSGKYYSSGEMEFPDDIYLFSDNFEQEVVNRQNVLIDGWQEGDYFVLTNTKEVPPNGGFYYHLFKQGAFSGLKKEN